MLQPGEFAVKGRTARGTEARMRCYLMHNTVKTFFDYRVHVLLPRDAKVARYMLSSRVCRSNAGIVSQVALLWQRDRATRLSVEILQLTKHPI